ncbi:DUF3908 family protein [Domibacillus sp. DTU_2020_1001157_1_SI_ALB_TIR_016]|uniref:DUF3908 family protein n=1 Tax=Domibacillus sp. DTU_2020_1001157_1_SI_ALB_TIR_016 TaxID=3077789 RepID=UPI0028EE44EC|nr:DUF3908 family protein [Domibacillus sp. DTU_2020_1001157_1_SI_ALB_TIR_016]WNS82179.1 DUF3908 family protein [Domibacillus sp. DTU_2020_1001157_1_SI_ALB_TIR_016]
MEITYSEFLEGMKRLGFYNSDIEDQYYSLNDIVDESKILHFYPKNYLFKDKPFNEAQIFLFEKEKIRIISFLEGGYVSIINRTLNTVLRVELLHKNRGSSSLTLYFDDGDTYFLDSKLDSVSHNFKLQEVILAIYKYL